MKTFDVYRRHLPHYRLTGAIYFITWRIHPNAGLLSHEERSAVLETLHHADGKRYDLVAWVVMDDHVHVVARPRSGEVLAKILHTWKGFTARRINDLRGRSGPFWQQEYYDRVVRDDRALQAIVRYVLDNPTKRWPALKEYTWVGSKS